MGYIANRKALSLADEQAGKTKLSVGKIVASQERMRLGNAKRLRYEIARRIRNN